MQSTSGPRNYSQEAMAAKRSLAKLQRMVKGCPTPASIEHRLRTHGGYVGQDDAVATLTLGMAIHARRILERVHRDADPRSLPRLAHLLIGPSGHGKTHLVRTLAAHGLSGDPLPFARVAMTDVTESGYWGLDLAASTVGAALAAAAGDQMVAEASSVIFCDELDKTRTHGDPHHRDVGGRYAQAAMLDLVDGQVMTADMHARGPDGRSVRSTLQFDACTIWVIGAGAFGGLAEIVARRLRGPRRIGFSSAAEPPLDSALRRADVLRETCIDDLVQYGMLPELCGRFLSIVVLDPLRAKDFRAILDLKTPDAPIRQWKRVAETLAFELRFTDGLLDAIARAAETEGLGARSLRGLVGRACRRAMCEVPERVRSRPAYDVYARCTLDVAALEDGSYGLTWPKRTKRQAWAEPGWSDEVEGEAGAEEPESGTAAG